MTKTQFNAALETLGIESHMAAARVLGIGRNTVIRYAQGDTEVPPIVSRYIAMLIKHGIPKEYA